MTFSSMIKNRKNISKELQNKVEKLSKGQTFEKDTRFWTPTLDAAGNSSAIIRFMFPPEQDVPRNKKGDLLYDQMQCFVKTYSHGFKGPTGLWYIEESPKTVEFPCPVCDYNTPLYATGLDSDKKKVKATRTLYISNILIVKDPGNPANNGKVFLFKYGKKIYEKLAALITPDPAFDMKSIDPFDPIEGANFRYRRRKEDEFPNYDLSSFDNVSAIGSETEIEEIWKKGYSLLEFLDSTKFKSYEELKVKFDRVMGTSDGVRPYNNQVVPLHGRKEAPTEKSAPPPWADDTGAAADPELESFQALLQE